MPPKQEFCKRGHLREGDNLDSIGACKICKKIKTEEWFTKNNTTRKEYMFAYKTANKALLSEKAKKWRNEDKEGALASREKYKKSGKMAQAQSTWLKNNPDKRKKYAADCAKKSIAELRDWYILTSLKLTKETAEKYGLIDLKRAHIKLQRETKNEKRKAAC